MSNKATEWAWKSDLPYGVKRQVLLALAHCHNSKTGQCNPRIETIVEMVRCSERAVKYALKELEQDGYIAKNKRRKGPRQASNQYALALDGVVFQSATKCTLKSKKKCAHLHPDNAPICTLYNEQEVEQERARDENVIDFEKSRPVTANRDISPGVSQVEAVQHAENGAIGSVGAKNLPIHQSHSKQNPNLSISAMAGVGQ